MQTVTKAANWFAGLAEYHLLLGHFFPRGQKKTFPHFITVHYNSSPAACLPFSCKLQDVAMEERQATAKKKLVTWTWTSERAHAQTKRQKVTFSWRGEAGSKEQMLFVVVLPLSSWMVRLILFG